MIEWATEKNLVTLDTRMVTPQSIGRVFQFFADPSNLEAITPPWLHFRILTKRPLAMGRGTRIDYLLRVHGLPLRWCSEITAWDPPRRFVDEQIRGPYRVWIHEHEFAGSDGGTEVRDKVRYAVPGGWPVDRIFVRRDLRRIFEHRAKRLGELLGSLPAVPGAVDPGP